MREIVLEDPQSGARAHLLPDRGFNCYRLTVPQDPANRGSRPMELLWAEEAFSSGGGRASGSGIPLLFPFPGRIRGATFAFGGRDYQLEAGDGRGNAIHGFVLDRPWQVVESTGQRAVAEFLASRDDATILERWPSDFRLTVSYELSGTTLASRILVENPGDRPLPWGFGTHPYFRVPLGGPRAGDCRVQVPARSVLELVDLLPTGERRPAEGRFDLAHGQPFGETQLDDVFTELVPQGDQVVTQLVDPASGRRLEMTFGREFQASVVYNPPHRQAICIEPYTCLPDPFWWSARGEAAGWQVLEPGGRAELWITIRWA